MKPIRKISTIEQLYEDVQSATNVYAIQYIFRISELKDIKKIEQAVNKVVKKCPGSNVYLKHSYYYPQNTPLRIRRVTIAHKELYDANFLRKKIDLSNHSIEVYLADTNDNVYLIFRFSHSVMDGKGALLFVRNVFNLLNGKPVLCCSNTMNEKEYVQKLNHYKKREPKFPKIVHMKSSPGSSYQVVWKTIQIDNYVLAITAKLSSILAEEFEGDATRMMIPVDLRRHAKMFRHMGNLTLPIFLNIKKGDSFKRINGNLLYGLKDKKELNLSNTLPNSYHYIPNALRKAIIEKGCQVIRRHNKFSIGAIVSHLGRVDLNEYSNKYFKVNDFVSLPVQQPLGAFSVVILEHTNKTNIAISYYKDQFSNKYIDGLLKKIKRKLSPDIYEFNNTTIQYNESYIEVLANNLNQLGSRVAIMAGNQVYTYSNLLENVERFSRLFHEKHIYDTLIIYLERSFDYLGAVLACIFNGVAFVPVDKTTGLGRLRQIIKESGTQFVLSENSLEVPVQVLLISEKDNSKRKKITPKYDEAKEVYDIFTSGTTGTPKCIPITNKNLNNYLLWSKSEYVTKKLMVAPLFTSLSVDLTITTTILPLLCGGTIKVFPEAFNHSLLNRILKDKDINLIKLTPTHLSFLPENLIDGNEKECFVIGGENLPIEYCESLHRFFKNAKIYNEYGPAETTVGTIYHKYTPKSDKNTIPIGKPINNTTVIIYDDSLVTDPNHIGEILISGDSVFSGYKNVNKDNDSFINVNGVQYYRTGDYGYVENGRIIYSGRKDNQVKIHGYRTELDEIEHVFRELEMLKDVVMVVFKNELYAFVIMCDGCHIDKKQLSKLITSKLSNRCIPDHIIEIKQFPIGTNGKVDKQKLLTIAQRRASKATKSPKLQESGLITILNKIKKLDQPSYDVPIMQLGLDSIDVVLFIQKCREAYIDKRKEDAFTSEIFKKIGIITLKDMEKIILDFGGKPE